MRECGIKQACRLDTVMKNKKELKAKKTKTQEFKTKKSRIFLIKSQNTVKFLPS